VGKGRLEAFSDGVLAIIITIMVLELKVPHGADLDALRPLAPVAVSYLISFVFVGIYWNNHHHLIHLVRKVDGKIMWLNLHLLFWLSLMPVTAGWIGEHHESAAPNALYGVVLLGGALAWLLLQTAIVRTQEDHAELARELGSDWKGKVSPVFYIGGIALAFVSSWLSQACYVIVAILWFVPDRRLERAARTSAD
jgi:uncharacterized membrane protein